MIEDKTTVEGWDSLFSVNGEGRKINYRVINHRVIFKFCVFVGRNYEKR